MDDTASQNERLQMQKDILWGLYQEHRAHARHNETLRATIMNMLIVASAALVSIVTYDKDINLADFGAALLLVGLGVLGLAFTTYYTAKIYNHKGRAHVYWKQFDTLFFYPAGESSLEKLAREADTGYIQGLSSKLWNKSFLVDVVRKVSNSLVLWSVLPLLIALIGIYLTLASIL